MKVANKFDAFKDDTFYNPKTMGKDGKKHSIDVRDLNNSVPVPGDGKHDPVSYTQPR